MSKEADFEKLIEGAIRDINGAEKTENQYASSTLLQIAQAKALIAIADRLDWILHKLEAARINA